MQIRKFFFFTHWNIFYFPPGALGGGGGRMEKKPKDFDKLNKASFIREKMGGEKKSEDS